MKLRLAGKRVYIRKLKYSDAEDIYKNVNDKEVVRCTLNIPHPYPKKGAIQFIRKTRYKSKKRKEYVFGIILKEENRLIGMVGLHRIDWKNKNSELGYWIGKNYWNKGLVTEAVSLILDFAFSQLKLHKVYAKLFEKNIGSRRVLEKSGFKLEGSFKEQRFKHNAWQNELEHGILAKEYKPRK